jgi:hypothetical protein
MQAKTHLPLPLEGNERVLKVEGFDAFLDYFVSGTFLDDAV